MIAQVSQTIANLPAWLKVILLAASPITEYQLSIPLAIHEFHLSAVAALSLSLIGASITFFYLYFFLEKIRALIAKKLPFLLSALDRQLNRAQVKLKDNYAKYGVLALFLFLVIPFPFTGVWTATMAAVVLKIPPKQAAVGIFFGALGGCIMVTLASLGTGWLLKN
jgi:uncharacterized membrane protein